MSNLDILISRDLDERLLEQHLSKHNTSVSIIFDGVNELEKKAFYIISRALKGKNHIQELSFTFNKNCIIDQDELKQLLDLSLTLNYLAKFSIIIKKNSFASQMDATIISQMIENFKSLQDLEIRIGSHNFLQSEGIVEIGKQIGKLANLKRLSCSIDTLNHIDRQFIQIISSNFQKLDNLSHLQFLLILKDIHQEGVNAFSKGLICLQQQLLVLDLDIKCDYANKSCLNSLGFAICQLKHLKELLLNFQNFCPFYIENELEIVQDLKNLNNLNKLSIKGFLQQAKPETRQAFFTSLLELVQLNLLAIDINFFDSEISVLKSLKSLSIQFIQNNNEIQTKQRYLEESLQYFRDLENLELEFHYQNTDILGYQSIGYALANMHKLRNLSLSGVYNTIGYNGLYSLAEGLKTLTNLETFYLKLNDCKACQKGLQYFFESLETLKNLNELNIISNEKINSDSFLRFFNSLQKLTNLKKLFMQLSVDRAQQINEECSNEFAKALTQLKKLQYFNFNLMRFLFVAEETQINILRGVKQLTELKELQMNLPFLEHEMAYKHFGNALSQLLILEKLQLSQGRLTNQKNMTYIIQNLSNLKNFKSLKLVLSQLNTTEMSEIEFWNSFQNLRNLQQLDYSCQRQSYQNATMQAMFKGLKYLVNLKFLTLNTYEKFTNTCSIAFKDCLSNINRLQKLKIQILCCKDKFNLEGIINVCEALRGSLNLQKLLLRYTGLSSYFQILQEAAQCMKNLKSCIIQINEQIREKESDQEQFQLMKKQEDSKVKSKISFFTSKLVCSEAKRKFKLKQWFLNLSNCAYLTNLNLQITNMGSKEIFYFSDSLQYLVNLQKLELEISNTDTLSCESLLFLGEHFRFLKKLEYLHFMLSENTKKNECQCNDFYSGFQYLSNLKVFNLLIQGKNVMRKQNAIAYGNSIQHLKQLNHLELFVNEENQLGDEGWKSIGQSLPQLTNLFQLILLFEQNQQIGEQGAIFLGNGIMLLEQLAIIKIKIGRNNQINTNGGVAICKSFEKLQCLNTVALLIDQGNNTNSEVVQVLLQSLKNQKGISVLELSVSVSIMVQELSNDFHQFFADKDVHFYSFTFQSEQPQVQFQCSKNTHHAIRYKISIQLERIEDIPISVQSLEGLSNLPNIDKINLEIFGQEFCQNTLVQFIKSLKTLTTSNLSLYINGESNLREHIISIIQVISTLKQITTLKLCLSFQDYITLNTYRQMSEIIGNMHQLISLNYQIHIQELVNYQDMKYVLKNFLSLKNLRYFNFPIIQNIDFNYKILFQFAAKFNKRLISLCTETF